jgi:hypothetical protein
MLYWLALLTYMFEGAAAGFVIYNPDQPDRETGTKKWVSRLSDLNGYRGWVTW